MTTPGTYPEYIRSWATEQGVILIELTGHRLRVTDYLPDGIECTYCVAPHRDMADIVDESCQINGWTR